MLKIKSFWLNRALFGTVYGKEGAVSIFKEINKFFKI